MTAAVHTPYSLHPDQTSQAWTTPRRLRAASVALAVVAVAAGVVGGVAMLSRQGATRTAANSAEPLVVDAQKVDVAMSDGNTTIAGGFLAAGTVVPAAFQSRFAADMAQAAASLTAASQRAGTGGAVSADLTKLTSGLPIYEAIVATAEEDNRSSLPVATAYLAEANNLMRSELLPAASALYATEQSRLSHDDSNASSSTLVVVVLLLLALVLVAAILMQTDVSRRFRRVINVGLVTATLLVLALGVWAVVAAVASGRAVTAAEHRGTAPLATLTEARILAQRARADDELALVTRDSDQSYQNDYTKTASALAAFLRESGKGWTGAEVADLHQAAIDWAVYGQQHTSVRSEDHGGQLAAAISTDQSDASPDAQAADATLGAGVNQAVGSFVRNDRSASGDLDGLALGCVVLMLLASAAILLGVEPRIREYR
jgi:hypothetical protein